jgi:hypothetical protein
VRATLIVLVEFVSAGLAATVVWPLRTRKACDGVETWSIVRGRASLALSG